MRQSIYQMVLESQLPPKIVNLLFTVANYNNKSTILRGELTFETHLIDTLSHMNSPQTTLNPTHGRHPCKTNPRRLTAQNASPTTLRTGIPRS